MISDLFRLALQRRRRWLDTQTASHVAQSHFNDADIVLLILLLDAFKMTSLVATDRGMHDRLRPVFETPNTGSRAGAAAAIKLSLDFAIDCPSVILVPLERASDPEIAVLAGRGDQVVAVYGWIKEWSPASWASTGWQDDLTFKPTACLSPALWRSGIQILSPAARARSIQAGLDRVASVFNDRYLDTCTLLEQIQTLEENLRGRSTSLVPDTLMQIDSSVTESDEISELKQTIEELHRTINLLQHGLAFAHKEIAKAIEAI